MQKIPLKKGEQNQPARKATKHGSELQKLLSCCQSNVWYRNVHLKHLTTLHASSCKDVATAPSKDRLQFVARGPKPKWNGKHHDALYAVCKAYITCQCFSTFKRNEHTFNSSEAPARSNILQLTLLRFTQFFLGWCHMTVQKWKADEVAFKIKKPKLALSPFYWMNFIQATCSLQGRFHPGKLECNKTWCSGLRWINV